MDATTQPTPPTPEPSPHPLNLLDDEWIAWITRN